MLYLRVIYISDTTMDGYVTQLKALYLRVIYISDTTERVLSATMQKLYLRVIYISDTTGCLQNAVIQYGSSSRVIKILMPRLYSQPEE